MSDGTIEHACEHRMTHALTAWDSGGNGGSRKRPWEAGGALRGASAWTAVGQPLVLQLQGPVSAEPALYKVPGLSAGTGTAGVQAVTAVSY